MSDAMTCTMTDTALSIIYKQYKVLPDNPFWFLAHLSMALYQNTSYHGPGVKISPLLWGLGFQIKREILKDVLVHILREALSSAPLPNYFKLRPCYGNWPRLLVLDFI